MKWGPILGIIVIIALMAWFEWPKINPGQKKEKVAFIILTLMAGGLSALLVINPDMPGLTEWLERVYKPFGKILEE